LQGVFWEKQAIPMVSGLARNQPARVLLARAAAQIREYLLGRRQQFDLPLDLHGTAFQRKVWSELARIPYGKTLSYSQLARRIGKPKAVRAVGTAVGKNPICLVIPCHRVVAVNGLGGFSGGLARKQQLLKLEDHKNFAISMQSK
jgi:methylated-DNA-[protein]-cysteine S-methyltransferase